MRANIKTLYGDLIFQFDLQLIYSINGRQFVSAHDKLHFKTCDNVDVSFLIYKSKCHGNVSTFESESSDEGKSLKIRYEKNNVLEVLGLHVWKAA